MSGVIRLPDEKEFTEEKKTLDRRAREYTKAAAATPYVRALTYRPNFAAKVIESWNYIMHDRKLPRKTKEAIALAVSMNNSCQYCVTAHSRILKNMFKLSDGELVELAATVAHVGALNSLESAASIKETEFSHADQGHEILSQIKAYYGDVPIYFRILSADPGYLKLVWERQRVIFEEGELERKVKLLAAFAVSITNCSKECASAYRSLLKNENVSEEELLEAICVCENFNMNNRYTSGLQLPPGIWEKAVAEPPLR